MFSYHVYRKYISGSGVRRQHPLYLVIVVYCLLIAVHLGSKGKLRQQSKVSHGVHSYLEKIHAKLETANRKIRSQPEVVEEDDDSQTNDSEMELIKKAFRRADFDGNKEISRSELTIEIQRRTREHINKAMRENFKNFFALDKIKHNGQVDWEEYYSFFVRDWLSLEASTLDLKSDKVSRHVKEVISGLKAAWSEAARSNPDSLNIDEFLSLEHPESSMYLVISDVEKTLTKYDIDKNGKLTRSEYINDPFRQLEPEELSDRMDEFDNGLDADKSGVVDRKELIKFLDPKNGFWASRDANELVDQADADKNGALTLQELLEFPDLFLDSKLIDPAVSFHPDL